MTKIISKEDLALEFLEEINTMIQEKSAILLCYFERYNKDPHPILLEMINNEFKMIWDNINLSNKIIDKIKATENDN